MHNKHDFSLSMQAFRIFLFAIGIALFIFFGVRAIRQADNAEAVKGKPNLQVGVQADASQLGLAADDHGFTNSLQGADAVRSSREADASSHSGIVTATAHISSAQTNTTHKEPDDATSVQKPAIAPTATVTASEEASRDHDPSENSTAQSRPEGSNSGTQSPKSQ